MTLDHIIKSAQQKGVSPEDFIEEIWEAEVDTFEKVSLSLALFDIQPTYHVLATMWLNYWTSNLVTNELIDIILSKYFNELSESGIDFSDSMEYSLYFDVFEDPDRNEYAWKYFLKREPNDHLLKIILRNSGPIPYDLKQQLYDKLILDESFHLDIYRSIRHSCFDNCGLVDKPRAFKTLKGLFIKDKMEEINSEIGFRKYEEVVNYLNRKDN